MAGLLAMKNRIINVEVESFKVLEHHGRLYVFSSIGPFRPRLKPGFKQTLPKMDKLLIFLVRGTCRAC